MKPLEAKERQASSGRNHKASSRARQRSRRRWLAFGLLALATTLMPTRLSAAPGSQPGAQHGPQLDGPPLTLTIRVYNYAKVSRGSLRLAESEAARIIGEAGIEAVWLDCPTTRLAQLQAEGSGQQECGGEALGATVILRVFNHSDYDSAMVNREVFGYADRPVLASVLYDRVARLADADGDLNEAPVILGDAMAHEIGHLLLGSASHSSTGIMSGHWDSEFLRMTLMGWERFTAQQARQMRRAARMRTTQGEMAQAFRPVP